MDLFLTIVCIVGLPLIFFCFLYGHHSNEEYKKSQRKQEAEHLWRYNKM